MNDDRTADHDLLIKLDTKFDILSQKFDALADSIVDRVEALEKDGVLAKQKAAENSRDIAELKSDVKFLNRYAWIAIGAIGALELYLLYRQAFPR